MTKPNWNVPTSFSRAYHAYIEAGNTFRKAQQEYDEAIAVQSTLAAGVPIEIIFAHEEARKVRDKAKERYYAKMDEFKADAYGSRVLKHLDLGKHFNHRQVDKNTDLSAQNHPSYGKYHK